MAIVLACTGRLRGEARRFAALHPRLGAAYAHLVIATPRDADAAQLAALREQPGVQVVPCDPGHGRTTALQAAQVTGAEHVHLTDFDRLVRWVATDEPGWRAAVERLPRTDCLIVGRTDRALATHPRALQQTEGIINAAFSHVLGQRVDLGGGSRGFSRRAVAVVLANFPPDAYGDAAWPVLLQRAGFSIDAVAVDGLDWETADHHQNQAAGPAAQQQLAAAYDRDAARWAMRVGVAHAIIEEGLAALRQPLLPTLVQ